MRLAALAACMIALNSPMTCLAQPLKSTPATPDAFRADAFQEVAYLQLKTSKQHLALEELKRRLGATESQAQSSSILLQEIGRPDQYMLLTSAITRVNPEYPNTALNQRLGMSSLFDIPPFTLQSSRLPGSTVLTIPIGGFVVVAHLDVDPDKREKALPQVQKLLRTVPGLTGNKGIQVLQWKQFSNHWTIIESWRSPSDFDLSCEDQKILSILASIAPDAGSPVDFRHYKRVY